MPQLFDCVKTPFMGAEAQGQIADADLVVFGAPHGTPYSGIDNQPYERAPDALRGALGKYADWLDHWDFDVGGPFLADGGYAIGDAGNLKTVSLDGPGNRELIKKATAEILKAGAVPVMMGGDDSTPIPFIEALAPLGPLTIIQIDAHIDWREERFGEPLGFSSTMRRSSQFDHVENIIQVGLRGLGSARRGEVEDALNWGAKFVTARDVHRNGIEAVLQHLAPDTNCLITFDCDGLDSSIMPAVMAPTPGGLTYMQSIDLIEGVVKKANLVAFDMVEFVPERDRDGNATFTAARILANVVGCLARK